LGACAGVDRAKDEHGVLVAGEQGEVPAEPVFVHDEEELGALCELLVCLGVERVAVQRRDRLLVERLLDAGLCALALPPNQVKAARPRLRAQGESDRFDAFVLCERARTDAHRFPALAADSEATKALRALTRVRDELVATRVRRADQPCVELERFWPGAAAIFTAINSQIARCFLERYRSPHVATLLAEIGDSRLRYPNAEALGGDGGMSAVAVESGKRKHACFWGCDKSLRSAPATVADTSCHHNPRASNLCAGARARGHDQQRAIRRLERAWTRVARRICHDRQSYDPTRHRGLQRRLALKG
jgi:transposase